MTLKDIAREFGVSAATVSRILNDTEGFSATPELRADIKRRAAECNYRPNAVFRSIRAKRSRQVAFPFYSHTTWLVGEVVQKAVDAAVLELEEHGYEAVFTFDPGARESAYRLPPWKVAGLIVPDVIDPAQLAEAEASGMPYVSLNGVAGESGCSVESDHAYNMNLALECVFEHRHRRIGYVGLTAAPHMHPTRLARRAAYHERMIAASCEPLEIAWEPEGPVERVVAWVRARQITALVCYDAGVALSVRQALWRAGIRVPEEVGIIAMNDAGVFRTATPPITCCDVDPDRMGRLAARMILRALDGELSGGKKERIPGRMILRESVAICKPMPANQ